MPTFRSLFAFILPLLAAAQLSHAQQAAWTPLAAMPADVEAGQKWIRPARFAPFQLDDAALKAAFAAAPMESFPINFALGMEVHIPHPDGGFGTFRCFESPVMEPGLAAQFPDIKTYVGQGVDDPAAIVRFDLTPSGFHAMVLSPNGDYWVDPYTAGDISHYASYYRKDYAPRPFEQFFCGTSGEGQQVAGTYAERTSGTTLRTFRLACAATGEYTSFHGGTVNAGQAAIVTAVNRVTGVYEREFTVRLVLIANNSTLVYTNSTTDPYTNGSGSTMLGENQSNITSLIGSANYDIGHVFSTGGGGIAGLGVVCSTNNKSRGVTGLSSPTGDPFYIDYVCHEMGHQFGASHTFNGTGGNCSGNRSSTSAYEPGSGSSIMSYSGICSADNLQNLADVMFHSRSHDQVIAYIGGQSCGAATATGNTIPSINAGPDYNVPLGTPFTASIASSSDPDGDTLTYSWEERDRGAAQALSDPDNGASPIFRSFSPVASSSRTFPRLPSVISGSLVLGEKYPAVIRTMALRCTVRDNRAAGGGVRADDIVVNIRDTGAPFAVTSPNTAVNWPSGSAQTVTWNVAGTTASPFNASNVRILLSTDGGVTFPTVLLASTPNNGSATVTVPTVSVSISLCRVMVAPINQIFFDVSNAHFAIQAPPPPPAPTNVAANPPQVCAGGMATLTATVGEGEEVDWYTSNCGGIYVGSGSPLDVVVPSTQVFRARARRLSDGGVSACTNASVLTISGQPTMPSMASVDRSGFCASDPDTITLSATGGSGGSYAWYADTCGGSPIGSGSNLTIDSPTVSTTYFVRLENLCGATDCVSVAVVVSPGAISPTSASADRGGFCADDAGTITLTATGGGGETLRWFSSSCGSASIGAGNGLVIPSPTATTDYFARYESSCDTSACVQTTVVVSPLPAISSLSVTGSTPFIRGTSGTVTVSLASPAPSGGSSVNITSSAFADLPLTIGAGEASASGDVTFTGLGAAQTASASPAACASGSASSDPFDVVLLSQTYVSPTGDDANRGDSAASPVQHIALALSRTAPGGGVNLAAGTYAECVTVSANVAITGESAAASIWAGACEASPIVTVSGGGSLELFDLSLARDGGPAGRGMLVEAGSSAAATRCSFTGHASTGSGGAIAALGSLSLRDCTLSGNAAADGGALTISAAASLTNCTLSGNTATSTGGAVASLTGGSVRLDHCTVAFNAAASGGGIAVSGGGVELESTIVSGNAAASGPDVSGAFVSTGYNLLGDSTGTTGTTGTDLIDIDPMLSALADNGGPTQTHAIAVDSPAVDHANPGVCDPATDQRGLPRPIDGDGDGTAICDIGAFESQESALPCPADFNQDGGVDGADVDAFFQAWEAGDSIADVNQDGGVDGGDVTTFFEAWEAGGC